ncbi:MAG TPA: Smr/MutS family protein [Myxococcales bacterium]|nr:Smr/MutS family protein [Myxococcales bacterium]
MLRRPAAEPDSDARRSGDEAALFREAAAGAVPLRDARGFVPPRKKPPLRGRPAEAGGASSTTAGAAADDPEGAGLRELDRRTRRRLRRGEIPVEARLDLHGLRASEAERAVARFIASATAGGRRCVLVVHGRGLNSPDGNAVLKEGIGSWLTQGAAHRQVLAFCPALPRDGGEGALYVLLRRAGKV